MPAVSRRRGSDQRTGDDVTVTIDTNLSLEELAAIVESMRRIRSELQKR